MRTYQHLQLGNCSLPQWNNNNNNLCEANQTNLTHSDYSEVAELFHFTVVVVAFRLLKGTLCHNISNSISDYQVNTDATVFSRGESLVLASSQSSTRTVTLCHLQSFQIHHFTARFIYSGWFRCHCETCSPPQVSSSGGGDYDSISLALLNASRSRQETLAAAALSHRGKSNTASRFQAGHYQVACFLCLLLWRAAVEAERLCSLWRCPTKWESFQVVAVNTVTNWMD